MKKKPTLNSADVALLVGSMKIVFATHDDVKKIIDQELSEKIKFLPSKDDLFTRMDKLSGEIQKVRDEQVLHQGQHDQVDTRLSRVEKKLHLVPIVD
jgi:hypothetical protein